MSSRLLSPPKDVPARRLSRSAENLATGGRSHTLPSGAHATRPSSPQLSSFSRGFKGLFHKKRESDSGHPDAPSAGGESQSAQISPTANDLHPVSYAGNLQDLPERPSAFNRVLQQIRAAPAMKKQPPQGQPEVKGDGKKGAARTRSDGSDSEVGVSATSVVAAGGGNKEEGRGGSKKLSVGMKMKDEDGRLGLDDSDSLAFGRELDTQMSTTPNYGSDMDEVDSSVTPDPQRTKALVEHLLTKIERTKELIKAEQKAKDENVTEYLSLAEHADKQQISRIKTVFEKKNTRSNTNIGNLQKKLENYQRRLFDLVNYGASGPRKPKEVLQGMHQGLKGVRDNIREGITGFSGGVADKIGGGLSGLSELTHTAASAMVAKPKEIASRFKNKFGSADNLDSINDDDDQNQVNNKSKSSWFAPTPIEAMGLHKSGSEGEETYSFTSGSGANGHPLLGDEDVEHPLAGAVNKLQRTVHELTASQSRLQQGMEELQNQLQHQLQYLSQSVQEERYRCERLEEQLSDLTDLHTHAMSNIQQELSSVQERLEYRMEERSRDYIDSVEQCQTRISKIELAQQHQQVITLEGYQNANTRALLSKFINVILLVLAVILVILSNAVNLVSPLVQTKSRLLVTIFIGIGFFYLWQQRELIDGARRNFLHNYIEYLPFQSR